MPWPKKIALFGKGSGKMKPPVGGTSGMLPHDIVRTRVSDLRKRDRAEFIKEAALIMLQSAPNNEPLYAATIAQNAKKLYEAVMDEINIEE